MESYTIPGFFLCIASIWKQDSRSHLRQSIMTVCRIKQNSHSQVTYKSGQFLVHVNPFPLKICKSFAIVNPQCLSLQICTSWFHCLGLERSQNFPGTDREEFSSAFLTTISHSNTSHHCSAQMSSRKTSLEPTERKNCFLHTWPQLHTLMSWP